MSSEAIEIFELTMNSLLKEQSFRRKNLNWIQETTNIYKVISIQKSQWGRRLYLNWGIFIRALNDERPGSCQGSHIGDRFDKLIGPQYLDFENELTLADRTNALRNLIENNPFGFLALQGRKSELVKLIEDSGTHDVTLRVREYLELA